MKSFFVVLLIPFSVYCMENRPKIVLIEHHLKRTNSMPIFTPSGRKSLEIINTKHVITEDEVTVIDMPPSKQEDKQTGCPHGKAIVCASIFGCIGVVTASVIAATVTLVVHFTA